MADSSSVVDDPLSRQLLSAATFEPLVADCQTLVEAEIARRSMAVRTAFGLAQRAKPGLVTRALRNLLPDFARELDSFYAAWRARGEGAFRDHVLAHEREVAEALLSVTDERIAHVQSRAVRTGYQRLRSRAEREVIAALPAVADTVTVHLEDSGRQGAVR